MDTKTIIWKVIAIAMIVLMVLIIIFFLPRNLASLIGVLIGLPVGALIFYLFNRLGRKSN